MGVLGEAGVGDGGVVDDAAVNGGGVTGCDLEEFEEEAELLMCGGELSYLGLV